MQKQKVRNRLIALCLSMAMCGTLMPLNALAAPAEEAGTPQYPYLDTSLSFEERAADLVSRMTLDEKVSQMGNIMPAIERLGIKWYNLWNEGIHGIWNLNGGAYKDKPATSFPTSIAMSCTWNPDLMEQEAAAISDEARALTALYDKPLSYWSPTINLSRDPRWGRNDETYGEDPYLTTQMGGAFVRGMQGDDPDGYLKVITTLKHFAANNSEGNRMTGGAEIDDRTLYEYYTSPFKEIVEADHPESVMTSYNSINGVPSTVNGLLVDTNLRKKWGFDGYVTSDDSALYFTYANHKWSSSPEIQPSSYDTAQAALKAGVDSACSSGDYINNAKALLRDGKITEADIDRALIRVFAGRMATGEFDEDYGPYGSIEGSELETEEHRNIALQGSREAIVLLQNENNTLPLNQEALDTSKLAIIGPYAQKVEMGGYTGNPTYRTSVYDGLCDYLSVDSLAYEAGASTGGNRPYLFNIDWFEFSYSEGKEPVRIEAESYSSQQGGVIIENGRSIGNVADGCYTVYRNVDLDKMSKLTVSAAGHPDQAAGGIVEVHVGSAEGPLMVKAAIGQTTGWQEYQEFTGEAGSLNYTEPQDLYIVYRSNPDASVSEEALKLAQESDVILLTVGTDRGNSHEGFDRSSVRLPYNQEDLIIAVADAAKAVDPAKKVIVQINAVGMVAVDRFQDKVDAILWSGYNGQDQGKAVAEVLFGAYCPSGRLSFSWYKNDSQIPDIYDYDIRSSETTTGRTYMYATSELSYPFGYGLSYTTFAYSNLVLSTDTATPNDKVTVSVDVENTGDVAGAEVVQMYVATPDSDAALERPAKRLRGFEKIELAPGEKQTVTMELDCSQLYFWDEEAARQTFDRGTYEIQIGRSSEDIQLSDTFELSGSADVKLNHATLVSDGLILNAGETAQLDLTVAKSDESFADNAGLDIHYESNNPEAVQVDDTGKITAVGNGVALITVTASDDTSTVTDSIAIVSKVPAELSSICLDGVELLGFDPDRHEYSVIWESADTLPEITATAANSACTVTVTQPEEGERAAVITVDNGEETAEYTITFGEKTNMTSDDFTDESLNPVWTVVHENAANHKYEAGKGLTITVQDGDLYQDLNSAKNLVLQSATGDWTVESRVVFSEIPHAPYQQAGLVAYVDDDNFIKLDYEHTGSGTILQLSREVAGKRDYTAQPGMEGIQELTFRLSKSGNLFTAYYSLDGKTFTQVGDAISFEAAGDLKVGMVAFGSTTPIDATFQYFNAYSEVYSNELAAAVERVSHAAYGPMQQEDAESTEAIAAYIQAIASEAAGTAAVTVNEIGYTPAVGGTAENPEGIDGTYRYTFTVAIGDLHWETQERTLTIEASKWNGDVAVESVSLDQTELTLEEGASAQLTATVQPDNATNKNMTWMTSDDKVATVENGKVTAVAEGEATITVTTEDGGHTASCKVTVTKQEQPVCTADAAIRVEGQRDENGNVVFHVTLRDARNIEAVQVNYNAENVVSITGENGFTYVPAGVEDGILVLCYDLENEHDGQPFECDAETVIATITVSGEKPTVHLDEVLIAAYDGEDGQPAYGAPVELIQDTATFRGCDINEDGKVDLLDVVAAMKFYQVKKADGEIWEKAQVADINGDEKVDLEDLIRIVMEIAE